MSRSTATTGPEAEPSRDRAILDLERANLNAWPSAMTLWDGGWCLRLTPGLRSRRVNSVTVFDRNDNGFAADRIASLARAFRRFDKPPVFRWTPLFPGSVLELLTADGWSRRSETLVMTRAAQRAEPVSRDASGKTVSDGPLAEWIERLRKVDPALDPQAAALHASLATVVPQTAYLSVLAGAVPVATAMAVADRSFLGLLLVTVAPAHRRRGHARALLDAALRFGAKNGAETVWLQVEADNAPAIALYEAAGFVEQYRYAYLLREDPA